jgi:hypothetical protein
MSSDIEQQLEAVRAKRAELADIAKQRLEPSPEEALALEQRRLAEDEALDAAQRQYGARSVRMVRTDAGAVIIRRPHIAAFRKFQDAGELTSENAEELVKASLAFPSKPEFDRLMREVPGALVQCASVCVDLAGFRAADLKAKS